MLRRVPRCVQRDELTRIRGDGIAVAEDLVDMPDPFGAVDPGTNHLGQSRGSVHVVTVPMSQHDRDVIGALDPGRQSPDVVFHVRARIDYGDTASSNEKRPGPVKGERSGVARVQKDGVGRQEPSRRSAASCSASLSAIPISATSSSSVNAPFSSESISIWP